jgi:hypothetical protein
MCRLLTGLLVVLAATQAAETARADGPIAVHLGGEIRPMTREVCAQKAVEAMGDKEKFPFAEITPDGNARGWNDKVAVFVLSSPTPNKDGIAIMVFAAGHDNDEVGRLRNTIRAHIVEALHNPKSPTRYCPEGDKPPPAPLALSWKSEQRPAINIVRHFEPAATLVLEKRGYATNSGGKTLIFGSLPDRMVAAFVWPTASAQTVQHCVIAASANGETSNTTANDVLGRIVRILHED